MAALYVSEDSFFGELANVWRLFSPDRTVVHTDEVPAAEQFGLAVYPGSPLQTAPSAAELYMDGRCILRVEDDTHFLPLRSGARTIRRQRLHQAKRALYRLLSEFFERGSPWGALTGIRPTKLFRELSDRHGEDAARKEFDSAYLVSQNRTQLAADIAAVQRPYIEAAGAAVYVGVPFCPSRCRYCSFISQEEKAVRKARADYVPALLRELSLGMELQRIYRPASVYVGGGTPSILTEEELDALLRALRDLFPEAQEFTVEAGRPDTVTNSKLDVLQENGANRICINPQSTNDATLQRIGRAHSTADFRAAMQLASGRFSSINCDMIIGLPGEDAQTAVTTARDILRFAPQNITVHALAVKNAAAFADDRYCVLPTEAEAAEAAEQVHALLCGAGYRPYYLYRQKYMSGNLENVGYALPGFESLYNIANMEETASVLAFGAGAISKRVQHGGDRVDRAPNVKNPLQYIERVDEMMHRKEKLFGG